MKLLKILSVAMLLTLAFGPGLGARADSAAGGAGQRRKQRVVHYDPPTVALTASTSLVVLASDGRENQPADSACAVTSPLVELSADAVETDEPLVYKFKTTGGKIKSDGRNATLDLTGVAPGAYTVTVEIGYHGAIVFTTTPVTVERCNYDPPPLPPCPTVTVSCPSDPVSPGTPLTFTANVSGGDKDATITFNWTVSAGTILSGQGTPAITVDTTGVQASSTVTATVDVGGYDRGCSTSASCTTSPNCGLPPARKMDEYGGISLKDEKARLANLVVELRNDPTAQGYIICYGGRRSAPEDARRRCERARDYVTRDGRDGPDRVVTVEGGYKEEPTVELFIAPSGVNPPPASPTVDPSEVKHKPSRRRSR